MTPERWRRIEQVYHAALARDESQRAAFLRDACAGDEALRHEVASLLDQQEDAEGFLEAPAFEVAANVLAEDHGPSLASRQGADRMPRPRAPWWIHLCAASFLGYFALVTFSSYYPPAGVGVRIGTTRTDGLIVASVIADLEADRAGVQQGDRLVAINGRRLRNLREYARVQCQCECRRRTNVAVRALGPSILRHACASSPSVFPPPPFSAGHRRPSRLPGFFPCRGLQPARGSRRQARRAPARVDGVRVGAPLANRPRRDMASLACPRGCAAVACLPEHGLCRPDHVQPVRGVSAKRHPPKLDLDRRAHARSGGHSVGRVCI